MFTTFISLLLFLTHRAVLNIKIHMQESLYIRRNHLISLHLRDDISMGTYRIYLHIFSELKADILT